MASKKTILIVDDEKDVIYALGKFFASKGYGISMVTNGEEAIAKLVFKPDVVVLDIRMPGVNGIEVLKKIKSDYKNTKTIVITGFMDDYREQIEQIGANALLTKPFSLELLIETIEQLLTT